MYRLYGRLRILVCTLDKALSLRKFLIYVSHFACDESSQAKHVDSNMIVSKMAVKTVYITGDPKQLEPFRPPITKGCFDYGYYSIANHLEAFAPESTRTQLRIAYRSHPEITKCVSAAAYDGQIVPGTAAEDRASLKESTFPVVTQQFPITLIHSP